MTNQNTLVKSIFIDKSGSDKWHRLKEIDDTDDYEQYVRLNCPESMWATLVELANNEAVDVETVLRWCIIQYCKNYNKHLSFRNMINRWNGKVRTNVDYERESVD